MTHVPSLQELLKAGVHFGHKENRWHPKMAPFIFTVRNGIHVIDLEKTVEKMKAALDFLRSVAEKGGTALFVGTKPQSRAHVQRAAESVGAPYVTIRWLGGTLTNFSAIHKLVKKLEDLEKKLADPAVEQKYTKLERLVFDRERQRLQDAVGGIRGMRGLPQAIVLADVIFDTTAVREARRRAVPTVALCDTNADPDVVTHAIPWNDDASKSIALAMGLFAEAIRDGAEQRLAQSTADESVAEAAKTDPEAAPVIPLAIVEEAAKKRE